RLDDLVEIADSPLPNRLRERPVYPWRFGPPEDVPSDQVARAGVLVARDRPHRYAEPLGHVLDETRLAAAGRPLDEQRQFALIGAFEDFDLVAAGNVIGRHVVRRRMGGRAV